MTFVERLERLAHSLPVPVKHRGRLIERWTRRNVTRVNVAKEIAPASLSVLDWWGGGCEPPPPNARKRQLLHETRCQHGLAVAVETGTFLGETTAFLAESCKRVITIELEPALAARARDRLRDRPHVTVLEGDSGELLQKVLVGLDEPALFWLDGHFSGLHEGVQTARGAVDSPLRDELHALAAWAPSRASAIVVDDARLLGTSGYPTLDEIRTLFTAQSVSIICDAVVIQPLGP